MADRDTAWRRLQKRLLGERRWEDMRERRTSRRTRRSPDRVLLVKEYLPAFAERGGEVLWVGVRRYTDDYPALLERGGGRCWTTDIDPGAAAFGAGPRHRTGDLAEADALFADVAFDSVLCNGIFGYGVDAPPLQRRAFEAMHAITRPGALLLLGWNRDKVPDPLELGGAEGLWTPVSAMGLPARRAVEDSTHVYDLLGRV